MVQVRMLVRGGAAAVLAGAAIIGVLHLVGPGSRISPTRRTISEYQLTSVGWAFAIGVIAIALGSAGIFAAAIRARRAIRPAGPARAPGSVGVGTGGVTGSAFGGLWVVGMMAVVVFPKANWAVGPSMTGQVHRLASLVAFLALPFAVAVLLRRPAHLPGPGRVLARTAITFALLGLAWLVPIVVAIVAAGPGGAWWLMVPLGLVERGLVVTEIVALLMLGAWAMRVERSRTVTNVPAGAPSKAPVHAHAPSPTL